MLVWEPFKITAALSALLIVAARQPHVAASDVLSMEASPKGSEFLHEERVLPRPDAAVPDASLDKPIPASTSNLGPQDTPDLPDYKWYWHHGEDSMFAQDSDVFKNFKPNDKDQTCSQDTHATPFNKQVRGVNLGGWLVLEPWITPSLFYQFLNTRQRFGDKAPEKTAMDTYTFCTALGKEEANRQLRIHYDNWVTEKDIAALAAAGKALQGFSSANDASRNEEASIVSTM